MTMCCRGQVGRVHRVTEKNTGLEYAAKFIRVQKSEDKDLFFSELEMLLCQTHPSIVSVHDAYETPRQLIIVMEMYPFKKIIVEMSSRFEQLLV